MNDVDAIDAGLAQTFRLYRERILALRPRPTILSMPNPTNEDWQPFKEAIEGSDAYRRVHGHWIWARGRQNTISIDWIADWTSPQFHHDEPTRPIADRIYKVLTTSTAPIRHCTALWGISIQEPVRIDHMLCALPMAEFERVYTSTFNDRPKSANFLGSNRSAAVGSPTTVIVAKLDTFPFMSDIPTKQNGIANFVSVGAERLCLALVALGSLQPIVDISWYEYDDDDLNRVFSEGRRFWRTPEIVPTNVQPVKVEPARVVNFSLKLRTIASKRRVKILSALNRFEQSLSRHHLGNQAIDLCTALEQILGSDGQLPISWSNGLRCAALIGKDNDDKCKVRDVINCLYKVRNQFVHGGELGANISTRTMGTVSLSYVLVEAREFFGRLIERLVEIETEPDWFSLETTGHFKAKS